MPIRRTAVAAAASIALLTSGCTQAGPPELTVYADGETITVEPMRYCDVLVRECTPERDALGHLTTLPSQPVQISVPAEVAETPWGISVLAESADGTPLPVVEEFFSPGERHAYTAAPEHPGERILAVEIRQLGAAWVVYSDGSGDMSAEDRQPTVRGWWLVELSPRRAAHQAD